MKASKLVPIEMPDGDYCKGSDFKCDYFKETAQDGPHCLLNLGNLWKNVDGPYVHKPEYCKGLPYV